MFTSRAYKTESEARAFAYSIKGCYKHILIGHFNNMYYIKYGNKM